LTRSITLGCAVRVALTRGRFFGSKILDPVYYPHYSVVANTCVVTWATLYFFEKSVFVFTVPWVDTDGHLKLLKYRLNLLSSVI